MSSMSHNRLDPRELYSCSIASCIHSEGSAAVASLHSALHKQSTLQQLTLAGRPLTSRFFRAIARLSRAAPFQPDLARRYESGVVCNSSVWDKRTCSTGMLATTPPGTGPTAVVAQ